MSDYLFGIDQHGLDCDPAAFDGTCGCDFDKAAWVEVDDNMFVRERTCRDDGAGVFRCDACGAFAARGAVMDCCAAIPIRYCPNCGAKVVAR